MPVEIMVKLTIVSLTLLYFFNTLTKMVQIKNRYKHSFLQIETQMRRRYELIPNLLTMSKKNIAHDPEIFYLVSKARNTAKQTLSEANQNKLNIASMEKLTNAEQELNNAINTLNTIIESSNQKISANIVQLSEDNICLEHKIDLYRQGYNDSALAYNKFRKSLPIIIFCWVLGYNKDVGLLNFNKQQ